MDIQLPGIDGFQLVKILKKISNKPIIAQTAFTHITNKEHCLQEGFDDYLTKPISQNELFEVLAKHL